MYDFQTFVLSSAFLAFTSDVIGLFQTVQFLLIISIEIIVNLELTCSKALHEETGTDFDNQQSLGGAFE